MSAVPRKGGYMFRRSAGSIVLALATIFAVSGAAQQTVPFRNNIPVAPSGIPASAAARQAGRVRHRRRAEDPRRRRRAAAWRTRGAWRSCPTASMLVTERAGRLRVIRNGVLDPEAGRRACPAVRARRSRPACMDVALHPQFAENQLVYLTYTKPLDEKRRDAGARARQVERHGADRRAATSSCAGLAPAALARSRSAATARCIMTTGGGGGNGPQDPNSQGGKVLRLQATTARVPADNPFVGKAGHRPEVYTLGHRSSLGLAVHPGTGEMWLNENGPNGGDEINILKPGAQLRLADRELRAHLPGPVAVGQRPGTKASSRRSCTGCRRSRSRAWRSTPATASQVEGRRLRRRRCAPARFPGTGHLERILFNEKMEELRRESLLARAAAANPRRAAGAGRAAVSADRRRQTARCCGSSLRRRIEISQFTI